MSTIYNIDFSLAAERLAPPAKRTTSFLKWLKALLTPMQWLRNLTLDSYADGVPQYIAPFYDPTATYSYGNWVVGSDDQVYQNMYSAISITNIPPDNTDYWLPVLDTYIGLRERLVYNSQIVVLEAILNKKFRITPPSDTLPPDFPRIYIDDQYDDIEYVYFYKSNEGYPGVYFQKSTETDAEPVYLYNGVEYTPEFDYIVKVPEDLQDYYPPESASLTVDLKKLVEAETSKYNLLGTTFSVEYFPII